MPQTPEVTNGAGDAVKVGTTGTISSLMSQELDSMKHASQTSSSSQRKPQTQPVSVLCSANPKRTQQLKRNPTTETGSSSSSNGRPDTRSPGDAQKAKHKPRRNGHRAPMLGSDDATLERNTSREKLENKKGHTYIVEVVDLKCNTPVSSRLKKLGFSKLSESIA